MAQIQGRVARTGTIQFGDASLHIWEEGLAPARNAGGYDAAHAWERQFKREVFARIVNTLNRLGWSCTMPAIKEHDVQHYGGDVARWSAESKRLCRKGDLQADLDISGRCITLQMFQNVNAPDRPDHDGRYQERKEHHMPYLMRLEMERARRRIRTYLLNVMTDYVFKPSAPVLGFMGATALEVASYSRRTTGHYLPALDRARFSNANQSFSADGHPLENGMRVYAKDSDGRIVCGTAFYSLNGSWQVVTGRYGLLGIWHTSIWVKCPGDPRVKRNARLRRQRLEGELAKAVKAMQFERAAQLRDILYPGNPVLYNVWHNEHQLYHRTGFQGYTRDQSEAGKFTADEVRGWDCAPNKVIAFNADTASAPAALAARELEAA